MDETVRFLEKKQKKPRRIALHQALEAYIIEIPNSLPDNIKDYVVFFKNQRGVIHYLKPLREDPFKYMVRTKYKPYWRFRINTDNTKVVDIADEIRQHRSKLAKRFKLH